MTKHRLARLKLLAQGAALVGAGAAATGCTKDQPPTINAPFDPTVHANATAQPPPTAEASASAAAAQEPKPHVNAPATPGEPPHGSAPNKKP